eukprot:CAMPEP_0184495100 /NCGR_PEP_ID=MMETSP0113_2-20130426/30372_1 /TAXON_ID=91329 /ORGANISM="Norrisiella sphaerica, Strain BC52" /LENGTH=959 /DNA_ID=CAMNT_0026881139 /DNA_START=100 /DNA_END=2976 /DNA_ORIENTATION=+
MSDDHYSGNENGSGHGELENRKSEMHLPTLVADKYETVSVHPLKDREHFVKVGGNKFFEIRPSVLHFQGIQVGKEHKQTVRVTNVSGRSQRLHIIVPDRESGFTLTYPQKLGTMAPGVTQIIHIHIVPKEYKYYSGEVKIHAMSNLRIPLHAYPTICPVKFPKLIDMGNTLLGDEVEREFFLESKIPVRFEYKITTLQYNPNFSVEPLEGGIGPNSVTKFRIIFKPIRQVTTRMDVKLEVSQFGFEPIVASVVGSCTDLARPGDARMPCNSMDDVQLTRLQRAGSVDKYSPKSRETLARISFIEGTKPDVQRLQSGAEIHKSLARLHSNFYNPEVPNMPKKKKKQPLEENLQGIRIPDRFNQNAVNSILKFQPGKLTIEEMKEAIRKQQELHKKREAKVQREMDQTNKSVQQGHPTDYSDRADTEVSFVGDSDQMREMIFLRKLKDFEEHEKRLAINPTKERIGQKTITSDEYQQILSKWNEQNKREAQQKREVERSRSTHLHHRTEHQRVVYPIKRDSATIELKNVGQDDWEARKEALKTFREVMTTLIVRRRVENRIQQIRDAILTREGENTLGEVKVGFKFQLSKDTLTTTTFPVVDKNENDRSERKVDAIPDVFQILNLVPEQSSSFEMLDYKRMALPQLPLYTATHQTRMNRSGAIREFPVSVPSGMSEHKSGSIQEAKVHASILGSRREFGRAMEENALLVHSKPAKMFKGSTPKEVEHNEEIEEVKETGADLPQVAPKHLMSETAWEYPGTKEWPYLLLRSHPSICLQSPMIPQTEVQCGEYALRPTPVGNSMAHKYYLFEENGTEALYSLRQLPSLSKRWLGPQSLQLLFEFADIVPLKHPHVDLDEEIPIQIELDDEDKLSDSESDDEETRYKPVVPTLGICRSMFLSENEDKDNSQSSSEAGSSVTSALLKATRNTDKEMDQKRLGDFAKLPIEIEKVNREVVNPDLRI